MLPLERPLAARIRLFEAGDAAALSALYVRSVEQVGARDYSPAQVVAWLSLAPSPQQMLDWAADGRVRLVAVGEDGQPLGFADLEPDGHIHLLFCAPEAVGRGVAPAIVDELERTARDRGIRRLHSEASEAARRLFLKMGFTVLHRRDFEVAGVPIHNYAVEKRLDETGP